MKTYYKPECEVLSLIEAAILCQSGSLEPYDPTTFTF